MGIMTDASTACDTWHVRLDLGRQSMAARHPLSRSAQRRHHRQQLPPAETLKRWDVEYENDQREDAPSVRGGGIDADE